jgi:signal transduction histidine kinase
MKILPIIPSNVSKHLYQGWALRSSRLNPHHDPIIGNIDKTWMYCFRDRYQQTRFKKILRENFDPLLLKSLLAVYMIVYIPSAVMSFRARRIADEGSLALASLAVLSIIFLLLIPGCSVIYIRWKRLHMKRAAQTPAATIDRLLTRWEPLIEKAFMIGAAVSHGLSLFARIYDGGQCNQYEIDGVLSSLFCNPEALIGALPQDSAFALVLVPCFLSQAVKGISWRASILAWLVGFISLIICVAYAHAWQRSGFLLVFSIFEAVRMLILHKQDMRMYISGLEKQKAVLEKLEAENKIVQAMELRNLIANMAHDLKSPLQAFSNSMTTMESIVSEVAQWSETSDNAFDRLIGCLRVLEDMTATNQFMAMTINRAIDYSKASHGITLMPTYRSLDIVDIINWPIRCMKSLQSSQVINIYCHPLPDDVFPYCITDGQWLQENMLCLLSNAVKFSFVGVVEIRISLVYEEKKIKSRGGAGSTRGGALAGDRDREGVVGSASPLLQLRTKSPMDAPSPSTSSAPACAERNQASPCPGAGNDHHRGGSGESSGSNAGAGSSGGGTGASAGSVSHPMIRYEVLDSGIGISPEAQATAFQPLNRSRTDRQSGGAGLGLYSLSKRVEALGGSCGIGPRPDGREGTLCWFTEPYRPDFSPTTAEGNLIDVSEATLRKLRSRKFSEDLSSSYTSMRFRGAGGEGSSPREPGSAVDQHHNISSLYVPQTQSSTHAAGNHHNHHQHHQHPHQTHLTHRETSLLLANPTVFPLQPSLSAGDFPPSPTSVTFDLMPTATAAHEEGQREGQGQIQRHHRLLSSSTSTSTEFNAVPSLQLLPSLPLKVLVVDDSPTILKTMARTLERSKHEVETAQNGAVALDLMKQKTYDAVLMDIQMYVQFTA